MSKHGYETKSALISRQDKEVRKHADDLLRKMSATCDRGGCSNHSGHEFCSMDGAWDHAMSQAEDALYERHKAELDALDDERIA